MDNFGCTTPYGRDLDHICKNSTKAEKAFEFMINEYQASNLSCLYPCRYLSNFIVTYDEEENEWDRQVKFNFKQFGQIYTTKCTYTALDLYAALGGYVGLFLGISLFNIKDGFAYLIQKVVQVSD